MQPECLAWLEAAARGHQTVAEIGAWRGRATAALLNGGAHVLAVDTWAQRDVPRGQTDAERGYRDFMATFAGAVADGSLEVLRSDSVLAANRIAEAGRQFGMVFLDGGHSYESVRGDIMAWQPCVASGGMLAGHDFNSGHPGVVRAVTELFPGRWERGAGPIWLVREVAA
jgi:hypothetical protein